MLKNPIFATFFFLNNRTEFQKFKFILKDQLLQIIYANLSLTQKLSCKSYFAQKLYSIKLFVLQFNYRLKMKSIPNNPFFNKLLQKIYPISNKLIIMWKNEAKERFTWNFIRRNLVFLFKMGIPCVIRNLKSKADSSRQFPKRQKYWYLYTIGVLPEAQGKGLASRLMNPVIEICKKLKTPLFLETANTHNVEIYRKKGFVVTETLAHNATKIFYMRHSLA